MRFLPANLKELETAVLPEFPSAYLPLEFHSSFGRKLFNSSLILITPTYPVHAYPQVSLEQYPARCHANQVGPQARPGLVVDLVEGGEGVVPTGNVLVAPGDIARRQQG